MTPETIQHNCDCFKKQMSRFIDFSDGKALMVNNADWLMDLYPQGQKVTMVRYQGEFGQRYGIASRRFRCRYEQIY